MLSFVVDSLSRLAIVLPSAVDFLSRLANVSEPFVGSVSFVVSLYSKILKNKLLKQKRKCIFRKSQMACFQWDQIDPINLIALRKFKAQFH